MRKNGVLDGPFAETKEQLGRLFPARGAEPGRGARLGSGSHGGVRLGGSAAGVDVAATAEAVARRSYGKLVAFLAARTRDVAAAEDALSRGVRRGARRMAGAAACPRKPEAGCSPSRGAS